MSFGSTFKFPSDICLEKKSLKKRLTFYKDIFIKCKACFFQVLKPQFAMCYTFYRSSDIFK